MICKRCGHELLASRPPYVIPIVHHSVACIANLRADLSESRRKELDAETWACAAEERAHSLEAALTLTPQELIAVADYERSRELGEPYFAPRSAYNLWKIIRRQREARAALESSAATVVEPPA